MPDETILCLSTRNWTSLWRSTQQIMARLSARDRVVFVEPQRNPDLPYISDLRLKWRYFGGVTVERPMPQLEVVRTPPGLPYFQRYLPASLLDYLIPFLVRLNNRLLLWHLNRITRRLGIRQPILWLYKTRHVDLAGQLGEKLVCYFNYDEHADFPANHRIRQLLQDYDDRLCRRADVVFASSRSQYRRRKHLNPHTHFVPNGVDYRLYSRALDSATQIPPEIAALPRPIVGYVGWIGPHFDVGLLAALSRAYPEISFVFVGPSSLKNDPQLRKLRSRANVLFTGRKRRQELPGYLKAFDAALIPDTVVADRLAAYPLKLHEYLAAGCSVIATSLPELEPFKSVIRIADSREAFIRMLPEAIADNGPERIRSRTNLAHHNSWSHRVAKIERILDAQLAGRVSSFLEAESLPRPDMLTAESSSRG